MCNRGYAFNISISETNNIVIDTVDIIDDNEQRFEPSIVDGTPAPFVGVENESIRTILDFLARPESLKSIPISNGVVKGTVLSTFDIPNDVLPVMKRDKIVGFKNFRADVHMQIRVNTNPMACGRLIIGYFTPNQFNRANSGFLTNGYGMFNSLTSMTACPHVEVDLASGESVSFVIPYISPLSHWDLTQIDPSDVHLKEYPTTMIMFVAAYTDLSVPSGSSSLQLFVGLDNVDLSFPTFPTRELLGVRNVFAQELISHGMSTDQAFIMSRKVPRNTRIEQQGFLSSIIGVVGKIASVVSPITAGIPVIGGVVTTVGKIATPVAQIASSFGYSKELVNCEPEPREIVFNRYAQNVDGVDTSRVIALSHCNALQNDAAELVTAQDEMSYAYMFSRSEYFQSFYWDSETDPAGATLVKFLVDPMICDQDFGIQPFDGQHLQPPADIIVPTHLAFVSHMHYYWRGSLKYTFKFAKTAFHVGRIRIMWLPGDQDPAYDPQVTYDESSPEASYFLQQIVDLRDTNEITFVVPFSSNRPFNTCVGASFALNSHPDYSSNGTVLVQALTNLSAPSSVAQKVQCVVEIAAGDDFELAVFKGNPWYVPVGEENKVTAHYKVSGPGSGLVPIQRETYGGINYVSAVNTAAAHVIVDNNVNTTITNVPVMVSLSGDTPAAHVIVDNDVNATITNVPLMVSVSGDVSLGSSTINANIVGQKVATNSLLAIYSTELLSDLSQGPGAYKFYKVGDTILHPMTDATYKYSLQTTIDMSSSDANIFTALKNVDPSALLLASTGTAVPDTLGDNGPSFVSLINNKVQQASPHHGGLLRWFETAAVMDLAAAAGEESSMQIQQQSNLSTAPSNLVVQHPITNVEKFDAAAISMGEHNFSARSLLKLFQLNSTMKYVQKTGGSPAQQLSWRWNGMQVYPQCLQPYMTSTVVGNGTVVSTSANPTIVTHYPDLVDIFGVCFGYWKGSMRVKIANMGAGECSAQITYRPSYSLDGSLPAPPLSIDNNGNSSPILPYTSDRFGTDLEHNNLDLPETSMHEVFVANDLEARDLQFQVPYYQPLMQTKVASGIQYHGTPLYSSENEGGDWYMPQNVYKVQYEHSSVGDPASARNFTYKYYRAIADDFSYHLLQGIPPLARTRISKSGGAKASSISTIGTNLTFSVL